jgi:dipeptidyl aminopeptidase/acylaminoacyl peptidase
LWDPRTGEEHWQAAGPRGLLGRIALVFSPDGGSLFASSPDGGIDALDPATGRRVRSLARPPFPVAKAAISPDRLWLAAACDQGKVLLYSLAGSSLPRVLDGHSGPVNAVAFSPDGRRLASAGEDKTVRLWNVADGAEAAVLSGHATGVKDVAFSPVGGYLASVGGLYRGKPAAEVMLWEAPSGKLVRKLEGHTSLVTAVAFAPDGHRLVTASDDRTIKLWDPDTGDDIFTLRGHTSGVVALAFSSDGLQIASGSIDCTARIWSREPPLTEVKTVRRRAAVEQVEKLFQEHQLKADVLDALKADHTLDPSIRAAAIEVAERRGEDAQGLFESAWLTVVRPAGTPELYQRSVRKLEAALRVVSDDVRRGQEYQHALALAYYRVGRHEDALKTVDRLNASADGAGASPPPARPIDLAVRAMASQKLGRFAEARGALDQLRELVERQGETSDQETLDFLKEAESEVHE